MSGIHFLGNDDFIVQSGDKGQVLSLVYESKGLNLVLFYSTECPYCEALINKFKQLPTHVNGCQFAMVNVSRNMGVVERSKNTIAPITYVPDLILYVNGSPYVRYDGPHDIQHISDFIIDVNMKVKKTAFMDAQNGPVPQQRVEKESYNANQIPQQQQQQGIQLPQQRQQPQQQQQQQYQQSPQPVQNIPAYTIGTPLYGEKKKDKVCYLNFNSAYVSA